MCTINEKHFDFAFGGKRMNKVVDDYSTDYDVAQVQTDPRFEHCRKDMVLLTVEYYATLLLAFILAYALSPKDVADLTYLFGLPLWAVAATLVFVGSAVFAIVWALKMRRFSLAARATDEEVDE